MADDVNDLEEPGTSGSVTRTSSIETPKKGILKRPSLRTAPGEARDTLFPLPQHRPSPDRFPDKPGSKIPKLQVTWWEKNAVAIFGDTSDENNTDSEQILKDLGSGRRKFFTVPAERHTAILDSEEDSEDVRSTSLLDQQDVPSEVTSTSQEEASEAQDDMMSVASSTGSASSMVVGRWWTGKDTRFVPHCVKRGCNHANHGELGEYLTPTQRRAKEMAELKKELRDAILERDEKDTHLQELRERIKEIEMVSNVQSALSEGSKLLQRERETREQHEKEKKQLERKHAIRVNQLVQETMNAREEISKLTGRIKELESLLHRPRSEVATNTDPIQRVPSASNVPPAPIPTEARDSQVRSPPTSPPNPLSPISDAGVHPIFALPSPGSPSTLDSKSGGYQQPMYMSQEALNHMQACQNEAYIWRTKAAQLEIVVKDQLMKASRAEQNYQMQIEVLRKELEHSGLSVGGSPSKGTPAEMSSAMLDSGIENLSHISPVHRPDVSECNLPACADRKKNLIVENCRFLETNEEANIRIRELEEDLAVIRTECDKIEDEREKMKVQLHNAVDDYESKVAELAASNIAVGRMQGDKETMQKAISYMEERMQVYQNTLMEHDLIVSDETSGNWRKGFSDPRYSVMVSKRIQTTLTSDELSQHESEFKNTKQKLEDLHSEFTANRSDLHGRFEEIERILLTKTQLVETLGKQLEDTRRDQREEIDRHQLEREQYKRSLNELAMTAEKVPQLETRIQQLQQEIGDFDIRHKKQQDEYETGLEEALEESLKKYKEQSAYWKDKVTSYETQLEKAKNEATQLVREKEELKLKAKLERVDLEQRLTSSIDHLSSLNSQMNKSRRDVECEARPRHVSKYVACRPNVKSKSTVIEKGDLFDEAEERLKLCQGELATTRRQVHVLQQKLISTMQERADRRVQVKRRIACVVDRPTSADGRKEKEAEHDHEKMDALQNKNAQLRDQLSQVEEEKASIVRKERERIQHLATEFDNVRKELDQEMCRYESEKKWLKSRIQNLEKDNKELQKMLEKSSSSSPDAKGRGDNDAAPTVTRLLPRIAIQEGEDTQANAQMRKTLSEPELGFDDDETARLRAENCRLHSELERVRETIRRTASNVSAASAATQRSQLSPAFANLADDLNLVKHDLEKILTTIDDEAPLREVERAISRSRTPAGSTALSVRTASRSPSTRRTPLEEQSEILEQVLLDWENEEKSQMARDLQRSREERDAMKLRIDRLQRELNTAHAELELFRHEPISVSSTAIGASNSASGDGRLQKSRSVVNLVSEADKEDATRWKLKCGTMFRELNAMRSGYSKAMDERRELRIQLAMMKGELELTKCQVGTAHAQQSMSSSSYFSPRSMRSEATTKSNETTENKERDSHEPVVVHESPAMFRKGSTRESVACSIQAPSRDNSLDRTVTERISRRDGSEQQNVQSTGERQRSRSGQRRRAASSKEEFGAMEERRRSRKSISHYATAPQSLSSSMASLHENVAAQQGTNWAKPPIPTSQLMSQSWHEQSASHMALSASFSAAIGSSGDVQPSTSNQQTELVPPVHGPVTTASADELNSQIDAGGEDCRRSNLRVVSLREKVGRLNRENKKLADELEQWRTKAQSVEVQSSYRSGIDLDRLNRLEKEKETLKEQVELLLQKIQETPIEEVPAPVPSPPPPVPTPTRDDMYLREQLTRSRQENEMFERKIQELEEERREMYLVMFKKGQQAATMDMKEQKMLDQMSEDRVVLKFLHDAFYYFMLNKGDSKEHLQTIMTMLDFSADQKDEILKKKTRPH